MGQGMIITVIIMSSSCSVCVLMYNYKSIYCIHTNFIFKGCNVCGFCGKFIAYKSSMLT